MNRFFDFSPSVWDYFQKIDRRFSSQSAISPQPGPVEPHLPHLPGIRAVIWDVYGTLCGADAGDLDKTLTQRDLLRSVANATITEFKLDKPLASLYPDSPADLALSNLYLQLIHQSHENSKTNGIDYPEVVIENIWLTILQDCSRACYDYKHLENEPAKDTAYRLAYFFDAKTQHTFLYQGINQCLKKLKNAGMIQGIISNAQFYTPVNLRRLLRLAEQKDNLELNEYFDDNLIFFSYELGYSKPNTKAFQQALDNLYTRGIAPDQICYVGNDMLKDIWPAMNLGMHAILFAADRNQLSLHRDDPRCQNLTPSAIVTTPNQIVDILYGK